MTGLDHVLELARDRPVHCFAKYLRNVQSDIDADTVDEFDGAHRHTESLGRLVDRGEWHAFFGQMHRLGHVRRENSIDNEPWCTVAFEWHLADALDEGEPEVQRRLIRISAANDFDQRQLRDRVEKVQPVEPPRFPEPLA